MDILLDMETRDPDDALTLCLLATHPDATLRAVTVNPGSRAQVGLVRRLLGRLGRSDVPVGARAPETDKEAISPFHHDWLGDVPPADPDDEAHALLARCLATHPGAVLLTGAPLHNVRLLLWKHPGTRVERWVAQGGFAGDDVVPPEHRLPKFEGLRTCPTFNFNGDPKGALLALSSDRIGTRDIVSKNVCHGFVYDQALHERLAPLRGRTAGLSLIHEAMAVYLAQDPRGKMLHDPLAACVAIRRDIATFSEVEVYRERGEWGARPAQGSRTFITIAADEEGFFETFARGAA